MSGAIASPEFLLTAACCRWPLSEQALAAVRGAAADKIDWSYFLRIVRRQRVAGLVHNALTAAGLALPPSVKSALAAQAQRIAQNNMHQAMETVRLQNAFDAAGIAIIVLKGVALGQRAYKSLTLKHSRDLDFLVAAENAAAALRLVEREGYALVSPARQLSEAQRRAVIRHGKEAELVRPADKLRVELQWRPALNPLLLKNLDASSPTQSVALLNGDRVRTLDEVELFSYLCVHGAGHRWSRLKWLADLNALIAGKGDEDVIRLYRHAQECGAGLCAAQALLLCRWLLGLAVPAGLARELQADNRVAKLVAIAWDAMFGPDGATELSGGLFDTLRVVHTQFLLGRGWRYFFAQCRHSSIGLVDAVMFPLPGPLQFLYPILRLPLWIWRRAMWAITGQDGRGWRA